MSVCIPRSQIVCRATDRIVCDGDCCQCVPLDSPQQFPCPAGFEYPTPPDCVFPNAPYCLPNKPGCCGCIPPNPLLAEYARSRRRGRWWERFFEEEGSAPPARQDDCPEFYSRGVSGCPAAQPQMECLPNGCCRCVFPGAGTGGGGAGQTDVSQPGTAGPSDPLARMADVIAGMLGGGGGIVIPQVPQPQVVAAPVTRQQMNPVALLLVIGGLAIGGYYVYQVTRRRA